MVINSSKTIAPKGRLPSATSSISNLFCHKFNIQILRRRTQKRTKIPKEHRLPTCVWWSKIHSQIHLYAIERQKLSNWVKLNNSLFKEEASLELFLSLWNITSYTFGVASIFKTNYKVVEGLLWVLFICSSFKFMKCNYRHLFCSDK